ncbi:hypothetical protein L914_20447 [Phytophthora nicotianae]|nr:hypothetical protein L914_20447 [Phytophthora nicotianae]
MRGDKIDKCTFNYTNSSLLDDKDSTDYLANEDSDGENNEGECCRNDEA